jgi:hypothetical protein
MARSMGQSIPPDGPRGSAHTAFATRRADAESLTVIRVGKVKTRWLSGPGSTRVTTRLTMAVVFAQRPDPPGLEDATVPGDEQVASEATSPIPAAARLPRLTRPSLPYRRQLDTAPWPARPRRGAVAHPEVRDERLLGRFLDEQGKEGGSCTVSITLLQIPRDCPLIR